jgi:DNA repair protein RadA/Sms
MSTTSRPRTGSRSGTRNYTCSACGHVATQWFGRCPSCDSWSSAVAPGADDVPAVTSLGAARSTPARFSTGIQEVDRVLGGGFVPGETLLLAGEPGIGKSTLVLQLLDGIAGAGGRTLLIAGEESVDQVALRGARLAVAGDRLRVAALDSVPAVLSAWAAEQPHVVVVDSVQTLQDPRLDQPAGSLVQVREGALRLARHAKATGTVVILVGHVTKDGVVAGPKTLEHAVDAVVTLEGDRSGALRLLRVSKNRFGSCEETGVFVMGGRGLDAVADPSALLLEDRRPGVTGSVVFPSLEGSRCVLVEVQALVTPSELTQPRRVALGLEARRLAMQAGILFRHAGLPLGSSDVFVSAAGGLAVREPAADLALCAALFSSAREIAVPGDLVLIGEIGLSGEVRRAPGVERRLSEAARLGFAAAVVPRGVDQVPRGLRTYVVGDLRSALACVEELGRERPSSAGVPRCKLAAVEIDAATGSQELDDLVANADHGTAR